MPVKTYKAKVEVKKASGYGSVTQQVTVQADSIQNARAMLESQYGKGCVTSGIVEER